MKKVLVIGRTWKFVEFLIPTLQSIWGYFDKQRNDCDVVVLENNSTRSKDFIFPYCKDLLKDDRIIAYYSCEENYYSNIWKLLPHLVPKIKEYEYVSLTDFDMSLTSIKNRCYPWLSSLTDILEKNNEVGAVSVDFEPMLPYSNGFLHTTDVPESHIKGFHQMPTDGWFYTVRSSELIEFINQGGLGPGMHGYNNWIHGRGKITGRIPLQFKHHGWLRLHPEYKEAYKETGIDFNLQNQNQDNSNYIRMQEQNFNKMTGILYYKKGLPYYFDLPKFEYCG